jgi:hypothetical protein
MSNDLYPAPILKILPLTGRKLFIEFFNGSTATLDYTSRLHTTKYADLADETIFMSAKTDGNYVTWGNFVQITAREVTDMLLYTDTYKGGKRE